MKRTKRLLAVILLMTVILGCTMMTNASSNGCIHPEKCLYSHNLMYKAKTSEHVIEVSGGMQATCYIYTEYYDDVYYCATCQTMFPHETNTIQVHSLSHN